MNTFDAAVHAARSRLRPILMTSFAFIFGVIPLAIASGPGQEMRQALGTAVTFGMLGVTVFGLIFTPVFYVVCRHLGDRAKAWAKRRGDGKGGETRSEEHTSELQSLMRISYAVFCLTKKKKQT